MPKQFLNRQSIASAIGVGVGASTVLTSLASGFLGPSEFFPENEGQYWQFRRFMHDIVCYALVDNGTFKSQSFMLSKVGIQTNSRRLNMQKPDLYSLEFDNIHLGEVSLTYNIVRESDRKESKYKDLMKTLEENGWKSRLDVILLDLTDPEWKESFSSLSSMFLDMLDDFISCLKVIHSDPRFGNLRSNEIKLYNTDRFQYVLEDRTLVSQVEQATQIIMDPETIKVKLEGLGKDRLTDSEYISRLSSSIIHHKPHQRPSPDPRSVEPVTLMKEASKLFSIPPTTAKLPKILQLGCPSKVYERVMTFEESITEFRTIGRSGGYWDLVLNSLEKQNPDEKRMVQLSMSLEQLEKEQSEGPGRKSYMKRKGLKTERTVPTHIGYKAEHEGVLSGFIDDLESTLRSTDLLPLEVPDMEICGISMSIELEWAQNKLMDHPISSLLVFYQKISNEIVLNSMRRRRSGQYVLGYSGFHGIYFLIAPGPQLRTESNVEFVKIISSVQPIVHGLSAGWDVVNDHWESSWLSVDIDRLKQWQRCFDKVCVSTMANAERLVRPEFSFRQAMREELACGNYALLALTYLENKQLTSVTNQTVRYLWMKSLGDKQFDGLMSKFPSRVNSVIQSFILTRSLKSCIEICKKPLVDLVKVTKLHRDDETGLYDETTTGVTSLLPRIFTKGGNVPISYNLNEIYWCMAYNKDRQNAAQDALRILEKIVKEESKYDNEINSRQGEDRVDYFLGNTSVLEDINHSFSEAPESHFYSAKAVRVGIRCQDKHEENMGDGGSWLNSEKLERILNKPLSEYATFKASVKDIAKHINPTDFSEVKKIGVRTKAIELIAEILENEDVKTACDIAMSYSGSSNSLFEILIQIFKKGQIGGVREIIILFIKARVMMNIVEEVARLICKSDKREILTKGRDKRLMMRGDHEEVTSKFQPGTPIQVIKESYDMTVWCQKFIPVIFTHIHSHHFKSHDGMRALAQHIFLAHSNKKIEYPRKLVEQWCKHRDEKHSSPSMQKVKEEFLTTGKPYLVNHSNMCQGIPHYNSSVLGLSCVSLRDALFKECLNQLGEECTIAWKTRLGSDDKGTLIALDLSKPNSKNQAKLLGQCERVSERLHCMELSIKSASGNIMYELNSAYMANLETLSPTIKYSLVSVDSIETTSCSTFVQESYSRIRQMRENGCSSMLCVQAHLLNKRHFYSIFSTGPGGENDLMKIFSLPLRKIPFDFGVYPMYDADLQDIIGPEFHNYRILKHHNKDNLALKMLYTSISKKNQDELFMRDEDPILKKDHFDIKQGLVRQLDGMRKRTKCDPVVINEFFENNPFMIIRGPETREENLMLVKSKLYTKGAAQSLRRTSPAIYIGRLTAFRSAKSWSSVVDRKAGYDFENQKDIWIEETTDMTYSDYLKNGLIKILKTVDLDYNSLMDVLYPNNRSLDVVEQLVGKFGVLKSSSERYSQAVRMWTVNNFNYEFTAGLSSILQTSFGLSQESKQEDVDEFRKLVGLKLESLDGFKEECKSRGIRPLDMFFYLTKVHKMSRTSRIQTFAHGPSTQSLHMTILSLKRYNHFPGMISLLDAGMGEDHLAWSNTMASKLDKVKLLHNLILMEVTGRSLSKLPLLSSFTVQGKSLALEVQSIVRNLRSINGLDFNTQKAVKLVSSHVLSDSEFRSKLVEWKDLNYTYIKKQKRSTTSSGRVTWHGDLEVLVSSGTECYSICEVNGLRFLKFKKINDTHLLFTSLKQMCKALSLDFRTFFTFKPLKVGDLYMSEGSKLFYTSETKGNLSTVLNTQQRQDFRYKRLVDLVDFKVTKKFEQRSMTYIIKLEDKEGMTATVCHSSCTYYPIEIPRDFEVEKTISFEGVKLNSLLKNREWFFNHKLPMMSTEQCVRFLKNDVDFTIVLELENSDKLRVKDYIDVREEVNEESFSMMMSDPNKTEVWESELDFEGTIEEMFRKEMDKQSLDRANLPFISNIQDWNEEVENEMTIQDDDFMNLEDIEENILVTRSFGYRKPKQRKSAYTISGLQQGAELRRRVLNLFFRLSDVRAESSRNLPCYIAWIEDQIINRSCSEELGYALKTHIIQALSEVTGGKRQAIEESLNRNRSRIMKMPLRILFDLMNEETLGEDEVMNDLFSLAPDYQEEVTDDEDI